MQPFPSEKNYARSLEFSDIQLLKYSPFPEDVICSRSMGLLFLSALFFLLHWSELQVSNHSRLRNALQDIKDAAEITNTWKQEVVELKMESVMIVFCSLNRMNHVRLISSFFFKCHSLIWVTKDLQPHWLRIILSV